MIAQLGLIHSTDYKAVTTSLCQQFAAATLFAKLHTESREKLAEYTGYLRVLDDKGWSAAQRQEVLRNHFIQGIQSPTIQLHLMREMPASLDHALRLAVSVELAQKRLHMECSQVMESTFSR